MRAAKEMPQILHCTLSLFRSGRSEPSHYLIGLSDTGWRFEGLHKSGQYYAYMQLKATNWVVMRLEKQDPSNVGLAGG